MGQFFDDVCFFKSRADANKNATSDHPNYGIGDGLLVINGELLSSNCDLPGYDRPAALIIDDAPQNTHIDLMTRGQRAPPGTKNAIAAGPNLVSMDPKTKQPYVHIPLDDFNVNIWEHASKFLSTGRMFSLFIHSHA